MLLSGQVVLVTGASRGLGFALAELMAQQEAIVIMCARDESRLMAAREDLDQRYPAIKKHIYVLDLADSEQVARMFEDIDTMFGRLDVCINNAGYLEPAAFVQTDPSLWQRVIDNNLTTCYLSCYHAFKLMQRTTEHNAIVNVSSLSGVQGVSKFPGVSAYAASKAAIIGLSESLAQEGAAYHIQVNCIAPGTMNTQSMRDKFPDLSISMQPMDIAKQILPLIDVSSCGLVTGKVLEVYCND